MVLMHHGIHASFDNGRVENHLCSLQLFGDDKTTAMSKTVGYTAAIGTKLILDCVIGSKGLLLPTIKDVYTPSLELMEKEGVIFKESVRIEGDVLEAV
jgi:saccharopine dehydrogenase-like NADP-dependent oxidoreductase